MDNFLTKVETKHGPFEYCINDKIIGKSLKEYGEYSEIELSLILAFIRPRDYVLDIGANIGAFSVPIAKQIGEEGKILCFEPQTLIFEILQRNLRNNNLNNFELFNIGLGKAGCFIDLDVIDYSKEGNFGGIGLSADYDNSMAANIINLKRKIEVRKLDSFLDIKKCDFLKMDVELMELEVLLGGIKFLEKFRPILWIENHPDVPNKVNRMLLESNYQPYWVMSNMFNPNNYCKNKSNIYDEMATTNVIAIPNEKNNIFNMAMFDKITSEYKRPEYEIFKSVNS